MSSPSSPASVGSGDLTGALSAFPSPSHGGKSRNPKRCRDVDSVASDETERTPVAPTAAGHEGHPSDPNRTDPSLAVVRPEEIPRSFFSRALQLQCDPGEAVGDCVGQVTVDDADKAQVEELRGRPGADAAVAARVLSEATAQGPWSCFACMHESQAYVYVPTRGDGVMIYQEGERVAALKTQTQAMLVGFDTAQGALSDWRRDDAGLAMESDWTVAEEHPDQVTPDMIVTKFLELRAQRRPSNVRQIGPHEQPNRFYLLWSVLAAACFVGTPVGALIALFSQSF